ncbi:MAG: SMI1/KNR4 family protein [Azoarcus sp.]|jgi:hypothetical protein|nr:SMI1/KNR4 family protein [Azoarcus sp.]
MTNWESNFEEITPAPPAREVDIRNLIQRLSQPPTLAEIATIIANQSNPFPVNDPQHCAYRPLDPTHWQMPSAPLPASYLEFLSWSDGPSVRRGEREFGFFGTRDIRDYVLNYHIAYYMPGAIPLGLDGGGLFAMFDTRNGPADEYPILAVEAGALDYSETALLATSFLDFCQGTTSIADVLYPPPPLHEDPGRPVALVLLKSPASPKHISALHRAVSPTTPIASFLAVCRNAPAVLLAELPYWRSERILQELPPEIAACLRVEDPPVRP